MTWEEINEQSKPKNTKSLIEKVAETIYNRHCLPKKYSFNEIDDLDIKTYYYKTAKQIIKLIKEQEKSKETEPKQCETELKIGCEGCPFGIIVCTNPKYNEQESKSEEPKPEECEEGIEIGCNGCPWYQCTNPKYKEQ